MHVLSKNMKGHGAGEGVSLIYWLHPPLCLTIPPLIGKTKGRGSIGCYYCNLLFSEKTTTCSMEDKGPLDLEQVTTVVAIFGLAVLLL